MLCFLGTLALIYCMLFYPSQYVSDCEEVSVVTPPDKPEYRNDCLHPCIRKDGEGRYLMIQTPYYGWKSKVENPIFYQSDNYLSWTGGIELAGTPSTGFNSDPTLLLQNDSIWLFWRELGTPLCDSLHCGPITVGVCFADGRLDTVPKVYLQNVWKEGDTEQCPILVKRGDGYYFYAAWYQYEPQRTNRGIALWKGSSLVNPDFELVDTIALKPTLTVDKWVQKYLLGRIWFVPKPKKFDMWHFDLFEYNHRWYMVSCAEKDDNVMLSVSDDGVSFKTYRKPLVNNHAMENVVHYRQYYYKPTAFVEGDTLHLFYTSNAKDNPSQNRMFHAELSMDLFD